MTTVNRIAITALTLLAAFDATGSSGSQAFEAIEFELASGESVAAQQGEIQVPENRAEAGSRRIPIRFLRFETRAATPGAPIVYLAGGPGGSGTDAARGRRWAMFDRLRDVADVIILDQRGTGLSDSLPTCKAGVEIPPDSPTTRELYVRLHRQAMKKCLAFWQQEGVDIRGYTTWESAADIDAVRETLRVPRVSLLGISYGTHLALATLKRYPDRVDRLVLASAEGLDHTVKRPALTDAYFGRLQQAIDANPAAAERFPNVRNLVERVLRQVAVDPPQITARPRLGQPFERTLGKFEMQVLTGYMLSDPSRVRNLLNAYANAAEGRFGFFAWFLDREVTLRGMSAAMDLASGISSERWEIVQAEAATSLLGDALNFPMPHLQGAIPDIDLGDEFRAPVTSNRPALFLSGTLDGRTYPEAHAEIAAGFSQGAIITIENAGHNLFFSHPDVVELIADFFAGAPAEARTLTAPLPSFIRR